MYKLVLAKVCDVWFHYLALQKQTFPLQLFEFDRDHNLIIKLGKLSTIIS